MATNKIEMYIENHVDLEVTITDEDDVVVDLTDAQVIFSVKEKFTDTSYIFQRKNALAGGSSSEVEMTDPTNGVCEVHIIPDNTNGLETGSYSYDVWVKLSNGNEKTVIVDRLVLEDVVKKTT